MKILLINPPFQRLKRIKAGSFPIGLGYLASVLREGGFECMIYNAELPSDEDGCLEYTDNLSLMERHNKYIASLNDEDHRVWKEIDSTLHGFQPDLVGITVMTAKFGPAMKVSSLCKRYRKECFVAWGGPHPTVQWREVMANEDIDFLISGEGEETLVELCQALGNSKYSSLDGIPGLSFKHNGRIIRNSSRELIKDLDVLPFPAREALMYPHRCPSTGLGAIVTTRGCPFRCAYCSAPVFWGRKIRYRSVGNVVDELKHVTSVYGIRDVSFWDDSFTANRQRTIELCRRMMEDDVNVSWECSTRVDLLDEELLRVMRRAGCRCIDVGIETGSSRMLKKIDKGISLSRVRNSIRLMENAGMAWRAFFMIGYPEETKDDIEHTYDLIKNIRPLKMWFSIFTPYPGTKLYEVSRSLNLIPENPDWSHYSHQSPENCFLKNMKKDEFDVYARRIGGFVDQYNNDARFLLKRLWRKNSYWPTILSKRRIRNFLLRKSH